MNVDTIPIPAIAKLREAMRRPECPICTLRQEALDRYFSRWVWDYINDPEALIEMRSSLGLCREHTWQLFDVDLREYGDSLGTGVIYEDLLSHVAGVLRKAGADVGEEQVEGPSRWQRLRRWIRRRSALLRWFRPSSNPANTLLHAEPCRACRYNELAERRDICWLVLLLESEVDRTRYAASRGLCLRHLRQALDLAAEIDPTTAQFLIDAAARQLVDLASDLRGYLAKRSADRRHEPMTAREQSAPRRVAQYFGGLEVWSGQRRRLDSI